MVLITIRFVRRRFRIPAPSLAGHLLASRYRRAVQPPQRVIWQAGVEPGMRVLEIGCGSGAFTLQAAAEMDGHGQLVAVDMQRAMVTQLKLRSRETANSIDVLLARAEALPLRTGAFDLVYLVAALPELGNQVQALAEVKRVLKPGGRLSVSEFLPDPDYPLRRTSIRMGEAAGFEVAAVLGNFWSYTVRFRAP